MCFKIFLSHQAEVRRLLEQNRFRKDRIVVRDIEWRRSELKTAFERRLAHFSGNRVLSFDEICEPALGGTEDKLLDECQLRPRTLFRMAHEIFGE